MTLGAAPGFGVYVHWPYCARICPYCDFNVVRDRGRTAEKAGLARAIIADLTRTAALTGPRPLTSIFFGGGTPSLMDPAATARIIAATRALWSPAADLEITLEANPTDAEASRFDAFAAAGVNRLSLGVQSLDDQALIALGRNHDARAARNAIAIAQRAFARVSIDLIYARPGQDLGAWADELRAVAATGVEHISAYQLTIEDGTAFHRAVRRGALTPLAADPAADAYDVAQRVLEDAGFEAYEVSNHARSAAARSRHNLTYWRGGDYAGVGPGAHGRLTVAGERRATFAPRSVAGYVGGIGALCEPMTLRDQAIERLLMGLRTHEGVDWSELAPLRIPATKLADLEGFVDLTGGRLIVTRRGRPVLDHLVGELATCAARV